MDKRGSTNEIVSVVPCNNHNRLSYNATTSQPIDSTTSYMVMECSEDDLVESYLSKACQTDPISTSDTSTDLEPFFVDNDNDCMCEHCQVIGNWCAGQGFRKFLSHFKKAISSGTLRNGNIPLFLFAEVLKKQAKPNALTYSDESLLWWIVGWKIFGERNLRAQYLNQSSWFPPGVVPSLTTLRSCVLLQ